MRAAERIPLQQVLEQPVPEPQVLVSPLSAAGWARLGLWLRRHSRAITALQITVVGFYLLMLVLPAWLPLPGDDDGVLQHPGRLAQFVFWGLWWPGVIVAVMLLGRFWCGLLCPEGALSEWVSHIGLGRGIPRWMKWPGWPVLGFVLTTVYGQLVSVYEYPRPALLILGGSTLVAMLVGLLYGRGKRVWCRHLCPVSGVFALLARLSFLHFRVDRARWETPGSAQWSPRFMGAVQGRGDAGARGTRINCAPMLDVRRLEGASRCHACGRCAGQRGAVALSVRWPGSELLALESSRASRADALLLLYGLLGVAIGAFQWSASPWFVRLKQALAEWLVQHEWWWLLGDNAPWWLLTHYPEANDVFSWLDGVMILSFILGAALLLGSVLLLACELAARVQGQARGESGQGASGRRWLLAQVYTPLAGAGLVLGLSMITATQLQAEGWMLPGLLAVRLLLLALGMGGTLYLAWHHGRHAVRWRQALACALLAAGALPVLVSWWGLFVG